MSFISVYIGLILMKLFVIPCYWLFYHATLWRNTGTMGRSPRIWALRIAPVHRSTWVIVWANSSPSVPRVHWKGRNRRRQWRTISFIEIITGPEWGLTSELEDLLADTFRSLLISLSLPPPAHLLSPHFQHHYQCIHAAVWGHFSWCLHTADHHHPWRRSPVWWASLSRFFHLPLCEWEKWKMHRRREDHGISGQQYSVRPLPKGACLRQECNRLQKWYFVLCYTNIVLAITGNETSTNQRAASLALSAMAPGADSNSVMAALRDPSTITNTTVPGLKWWRISIALVQIIYRWAKWIIHHPLIYKISILWWAVRNQLRVGHWEVYLWRAVRIVSPDG